MRRFIALLALLVFTVPCEQLPDSVLSAQATAAYPLRFNHPLPVGQPGVGLNSGNRIYRAHPDMPNEFRAGVTGGVLPYRFELVSGPAGMTVDEGPCSAHGPAVCTSGMIRWPNPSGTANATLRACDAVGTCIQTSWSITTNANLWCVMAGNGNDNNAGTMASPWRSFAKVRSSCGAGKGVIMRDGVFPFTGMPTTTPGDCFLQTAFTEHNGQPIIFVGYPGENPTVDFAYTGASNTGACNELYGDNIWVSGLNHIRMRSIGYQVLRPGDWGPIFQFNTFDGLLNGQDGSNSAFVMSVSDYSWGDSYQNNVFKNGTGGNSGCALKLYEVERGLVEDNHFENMIYTEATVAMKFEVKDLTIRGNTFVDMPTAIGGNMNGSSGFKTSGEITRNRIWDVGNASNSGAITLGVAKIFDIGAFFIHDNTIEGRISINDMQAGEDGPYRFERNVIVNGGGGGGCPQRISCTGLGSTAPLVMVDNLQGAPADGIVDSQGKLAGSYRTSFLGIRGFEYGDSGNEEPIGPTAPTRVRIIRPAD